MTQPAIEQHFVDVSSQGDVKFFPRNERNTKCK